MDKRIKGFLQLIFVILFVVLSFFVSSLLQYKKEGVQTNLGEERVLYVDSMSVSPQPYRVTFKTTGTIEARAQINIISQVSGRVVQVSENLFEGGFFVPEEQLFQIDLRDFELEVERLEAQVASAKTALDLEQAESKAALLEWQQVNGDKQAPDLVARKPQLQEAKANYKAAQAQLKNAKLDLERASFSFPFAGRVTNNQIEIGQYISAGQSYGEVFDVQGLEIKSSLTNKQLKWLLQSDKIQVKVKANYLGEEKEYDGYLKRSAASLDSQTRFASVSFGLQEGFDELVPGVFVWLEVKGAELDGITVLPASSIQKDNIVWQIKDDMTIAPFTPEIIYSDDTHVAIKNNAGSMKIVTSKISGGTTGMKVETADKDVGNE